MNLFKSLFAVLCVVMLSGCFDSKDHSQTGTTDAPVTPEDPVTPEEPATYLQMVIDQEYVVEEGDRVVPDEASDFSIRHQLADNEKVVVLRSGSARLYY